MKYTDLTPSERAGHKAWVAKLHERNRLKRERIVAKCKSDPEWFIYYSILNPNYYRNFDMVDSFMTTEQIREHADKYLEEQVPYVWRHTTCMCYQPKYDNQSLVCRGCGKIARWRLQRCEECRQQYIAGDFTHHARTEKPYTWWCFDCLVADFGEADGDVPPTHVAGEAPKLDFSFSLDF